MKKANTGDMFKLMRLIDELKISDTVYEMIKEVEEKGTNNVNVERMGFNLIATLISKASTKEAEIKIYDFLSGPFEMTAEEIQCMDYTEFGKGIGQVLDLNSIIGFFKSANRTA